MQEQLAAHDEEWNVMSSPCEEKETSGVVEAGSST